MTSQRHKGPGRPRATAQARSHQITIRLTPDERQRVQDDADAAGLMLAEYVRRRLLRPR